MAQLEVQIGADVSDLLKKLNLTEKELKELAITAAKTGKTVEQVLKESGKGGKAFQQGTQLATKGMNDLGKSTANAVPTLTSFSQVIQDAPYGIRGVANNITQLTSQFGYLSKSSGGAVGALKAMGASLIGPAGILFAVSAVTSLLVSYGDEIGNIIAGNSDLEASQKRVTKAVNEFYGGQVAQLNSYVSILENVNTTEEQRKEITEELIKTVPSLTKADFAYGNNLDIVKQKIGQYVLAQASRIEADTLVEENSEKLAKKARITQINSITDQEKRVEAFRKFLKEEGERITKTSLTATYTAGGQVRDIDKTADEITADFNKFADKLENDLKPVQERLNELYGITFGGGNAKAEDVETPKVKTIRDTGEKARIAQAQKNAETLLFIEQDLANDIGGVANSQWEEVNNIYKSSGAELTDYLTKLKEDEAFKLELETDNFRVDFAVSQIELLENRSRQLESQLSRLGIDPNQFNLEAINLEQFDLLEQKLRVIGDVTNVIGNAVGSSIGAMVDKLGEALSTGNEFIDTFIGSLLNSMAQLLTQLLTQQIAQAAAQTAISSAAVASEAAAGTARAVTSGLVAKAQGVQIATSAAAALGPFGIAALPGLIAGVQAQILGALALSKIPSFATGGFSGDNNLAFLNKNELVLRPFEQSMLLNALRGSGMSNISNNPISNNVGGNIYGEVVLRGTNQVIQLKRSEKKMNRFYNS